MAEMDVQQVLRILPQRFPILMIDRVLECDPGRRVVALKNVTANEPQFLGHFPGRPIMPGVMLLEAFAQAATVLIMAGHEDAPAEEHIYYYVGIDKARFKKPVVPGDQLVVEVALERAMRGIGRFACVARVANEVVAEASILCTTRPAPQ